MGGDLARTPIAAGYKFGAKIIFDRPSENLVRWGQPDPRIFGVQTGRPGGQPAGFFFAAYGGARPF